MTDIQLRRLAGCRAGDKGSDSILVFVPYDPAHVSELARLLTPSVIGHHFGLSPGDVGVVVAAGLGAIVFTLRGRLAGGVTRSARLDPHGKTLSGHLLSLRIPWATSA